MRIREVFSLFKQSFSDAIVDYTEISVKKAVFLLAIPMILELSLESVFAIVDIFFVAKLGQNAIAAVGLTESVVSLIYGVAIGLSISATAMVARRIGEKNHEGASKATAQVLLLSIIIVLIISLIGSYYSEEILGLMGASAEVIAEGAIYTRIMFGGSISIILLFLINGIFRGVGNASMAMRSLWIASIINIILDPILIHYMGIKGAAIATVIGRSAGVVYQCYYLFFKSKQLTFKPSFFKPDSKLLKSLIEISWPATVQFLVATGSWVILAKLVAETGGTAATAGYQIAIRNMIFFILPAWGFSNAVATLVGQNLGANKIERAVESIKITAYYNAFFMSIVSVIFIFLPEMIIQFFTQDAEVIAHAVSALRIIGSGFIFYGVGMVMVQTLNGAGDTKTPTYINIVGFWIFQIPFAYFMAVTMDFSSFGVFLSIPLAETLMTLLGIWFVWRGKWKTVKI